ncbi:MAG: hypothetical protein QM736_20775 [Vicinamibacterales bacterium]
MTTTDESSFVNVADARQRDEADASDRTLEWILRVGAFLCFVGHGAFGIITKEAWVPYFGVAGIGRDAAFQLMPLVGTVDIVMGCTMLLWPLPAVAYWMTAWAVWTALLRPLSGEPGWETLERAGNYGVPLTLALLMATPRTIGDLFRAARVRAAFPPALAMARWALTIAVALLMIGHGALGVMGKTGITTNFASVVAPAAASTLTVYGGWLEIAMGVCALAWPQPAFLLVICAWKLATESLFITAGAPVWELVERGGSYAAPLALAWLLSQPHASTAGALADAVDVEPRAV